MVVICEHRAVLRIAAVDKRARSADPHRPSAGTVDGRPVGTPTGLGEPPDAVAVVFPVYWSRVM